MLRLAFDFIITWRETRTRPNAYPKKSFLSYTNIAPISRLLKKASLLAGSSMVTFIDELVEL